MQMLRQMVASPNEIELEMRILQQRNNNAKYHGGREMIEIEVQGNRKRWRPKRRWMDYISEDLGENNLNLERAKNSNTWRRIIHNGEPEQGDAWKKKVK